jgi:PAS domain S-box-containing protein
VVLVGAAALGLRRQAALAASEGRYHTLVGASPDALLISDRGRIAWVDPAGSRLLGAARSDALLGRATAELVHPACRGQAEESFRLALADGAAPPVELRLVRLDGGEVTVEARAAAIPSEAGTVVLVSLRDRVDHEATALALQESEARFRALAGATREAVAIHDNGRIVEVNDAFCALFGYPREEAIGLHPQAVIAPAARADAVARATSRHAEPYKSLGLRRDGTVFPVEFCGKPIVYRGRAMRVGLVRDITARKAAEAERERLVAELAAERAYLESILAQMPAGLAIAEAPSGRLLLHNDRAIELLRHPMLPAADYTGYAAYGALHDDGSAYAPEEHPIARAVMRGEVVRQEEMDYRRGDGTLTRFVVNAAPVRAADGRIIAAVSMFEDIGERKRQERALAASEQRLRLALDAGGMGTFFWDIAGDRFEWDAAHCALFGAPGPTAVKSSEEASAFIHPDDHALVWRNLEQALETGQAFAAEFRIRGPDRVERWVAARGAVVRDAQARPVAMHGVNFDITERKKAEQRQALLVRELNHRVKNILAVTQGVAHLTAAAAGSLDEFRHTFQGRLQAVANELLAGSGWHATRLEAVLQRALRPHGVQDEHRFELHVDDAPLSAALTQDLALALHELATNAAKYGALSAPEGRVVVRAGRVQGGGPALRLVWCELGGPPVAAPARQGFGTKLLRQLVGQQRGQLEQDWRASGLVCTVELPLREGAAGPGDCRPSSAA